MKFFEALFIIVGTVVGAIFLGGLILIPCAIVEGFVISTLWGWFIVPAFGLPALKITTAIGLTLVYGALRPAPQPKKGEESNLGRTLGHRESAVPAHRRVDRHAVHVIRDRRQLDRGARS